MKIFVNDKPLELISFEELDSSKTFEHSYQQVEEIPEEVEWEGDVIFFEPSHDLVIRLLYLMRTRKMKQLDSITLVTSAKGELKKFVKSRFLIVKAAGGVVTKNNGYYLFIDLGNGTSQKENLIKGRPQNNVQNEK